MLVTSSHSDGIVLYVFKAKAGVHDRSVQCDKRQVISEAKGIANGFFGSTRSDPIPKTVYLLSHASTHIRTLYK